MSDLNKSPQELQTEVEVLREKVAELKQGQQALRSKVAFWQADSAAAWNKCEERRLEAVAMTEEARLCREEWNRANRYWCETKDQLAATMQERDEYKAGFIGEGQVLTAAQARIKELREALEMWESLIEFQYTGSSEAMSAFQSCDSIGQKALATPDDSSALDTALKAEREKICNWIELLQLSERQREIIRRMK